MCVFAPKLVCYHILAPKKELKCQPKHPPGLKFTLNFPRGRFSKGFGTQVSM